MKILSINNRREQTYKGCALFKNKKVVNQTSDAYKNISKDSDAFIKEVYKFLKKNCNRPVEINVETGKIMDIVNSDEGSIFIMNHTMKSFYDIYAAKFFNALLYREFLYNDKAKSCPRSKIFANKKILESKSDGGEYYRWLGVLPLNLGRKSQAKNDNSKMLSQVAEEIGKNKTNLFIFPEGALLSLFFLPMQYKFQAGVSAIVKRVLELRNSVKVIPLGFAHNKKESAIHIGEPVVFRKENGKYFASSGNIESPNFDKEFADFYSGRDEIPLTKNGNPVGYNEVVPYVSGILLRNLESCVKDAKQDLKNSSGKVYEL